MIEFLKSLKELGAFATILLGCYLAWKFILSSMFEIWLKNKLEIRKQELSIALSLEKETAVKMAEFEIVKLNRVLPLLEATNSSIQSHKMMYFNYLNSILNKGGIADSLESERLKIDKDLTKTIFELSIYLPNEFRKLLYTIRCVVSCSWIEPLKLNRVLREIGGARDVLDAANSLYTDLTDCFFNMSAKYVGSTENAGSYSDILKEYNLDDMASTTRQGAINQLAWKFILLPEYHGSSEIMAAQAEVEKKYTNPAK